jgi:hypothetical protein
MRPLREYKRDRHGAVVNRSDKARAGPDRDASGVDCAHIRDIWRSRGGESAQS